MPSNIIENNFNKILALRSKLINKGIDQKSFQTLMKEKNQNNNNYKIIYNDIIEILKANNVNYDIK